MIFFLSHFFIKSKSHLVRGVWIEIVARKLDKTIEITSHLVRGVWIEMVKSIFGALSYQVAPRERCVD